MHTQLITNIAKPGYDTFRIAALYRKIDDIDLSISKLLTSKAFVQARQQREREAIGFTLDADDPIPDLDAQIERAKKAREAVVASLCEECPTCCTREQVKSLFYSGEGCDCGSCRAGRPCCNY